MNTFINNKYSLNYVYKFILVKIGINKAIIGIVLIVI